MRDALAATLATFRVVLSRDGARVEEGCGANVLDSPAHALVHLNDVLASQPREPAARRGRDGHHRHADRRLAGRAGRDLDERLRRAAGARARAHDRLIPLPAAPT